MRLCISLFMPTPNCAHAFSVNSSVFVESTFVFALVLIGIAHPAKTYGSNIHYSVMLKIKSKY